MFWELSYRTALVEAFVCGLGGCNATGTGHQEKGQHGNAED